MYDKYVGKYVICRSRSEGINAGCVVSLDQHVVVLADARRLWDHRPLKPGGSWYEGVANSGLHPDSQISESVIEKFIAEDYSLTLCTPEAEASIRAFPSHQGSN